MCRKVSFPDAILADAMADKSEPTPKCLQPTKIVWQIGIIMLNNTIIPPQRCLTHTATGNGRPVLDIATYRGFESYRGITSTRRKKYA